MKGWTVDFVLLLALAIFCHVDAGVLKKGFRTGRLGLPPLDASSTKSTIVVETLNFTQLLDHFEPTNENTWNQKYFASTSYFKKGGPVFLYISGEVPAQIELAKTAAWTVNAKKYKALMFTLEHRFYGDSQPTSDVSVDNLRYLTTEQALADIATFVVGMNEKYGLPSDTKWIAFGGSYAGNLAAWVRYKYPHLIHGAQSSSALVLAKVDFYEYFDLVKASLAKYDSSCPTNVEAANEQVLAKLNTTGGVEELGSIFNFCTSLDASNALDVSTFFYWLTIPFALSVQNNNEGGFTISRVCDIMANSSKGDLLHRLAAVYHVIEGAGCLHTRYDYLLSFKNLTSWADNYSGSRQWTYQTCTELGYFQTNENSTELFASDVPLEFYLQQCIDLFGQNFTSFEVHSGVNRTNINYGGKNIQATRVAFVNGNVDPCRALGVTKTILPSSPAILINGEAHCADMLPPEPTDSPALKAARKKIEKLIGKWLKEK